MVVAARQSEASLPAQQPGIDFPFRVVLEHGAVELRDMFRVAQAFDFYELGDGSGRRRDLFVDVVETTPTTTTLLVTPSKLMPYEAISLQVEQMVAHVGRAVFPGMALASRIAWQIDRPGVASDLRGRLRTVS